MRVYVYVDGFNLYYRAIKNSGFKWINILKLAQRLLSPDDSVHCVRYFTARVSPRGGNSDAPRNQQILLSAYQTIPEIKIHYGKFLPKTKRRPLVSNPDKFVEIHDVEEKGSDVNLAVHLLNDGWKNSYDLALVLSQDTDLLEPLKIVKTQLGKTIGLVWLDGGRPNNSMRLATSFVRHLSKADLAASLFPDQILTSDGRQIHKPATW